MKNVIITVEGIQVLADAPEDNVQLITEGEYTCQDGCGHFTYEETEITGMEGTSTSFDFTPEEVIISREGTVRNRMVFVQGKKNVFLYETPYGAMTMGIDTHSISSTLGPNGGQLDIDYTLSFDQVMVSRNRFIVKIKEQVAE